MKIKDPKTGKETVVPAGLNASLEHYDARGRVYSRRGNKIYDPLVDSSINELADYLHDREKDGYKLSATDLEFLQKHFGINADFSVDKTAVRRWLTRENLSGNWDQHGCADKAPEFTIVFDDEAGYQRLVPQEYREQVEENIKEITANILEGARLCKNEMPSVIRITVAEGKPLAMYQPDISQEKVLKETMVKNCERPMNKWLNNIELTERELEEAAFSGARIQDIVGRFISLRRSGGEMQMSVNIPKNFAEALAIENKDPSYGAEMSRVYTSSVAGVIGHETAHLLELASHGQSHKWGPLANVILGAARASGQPVELHEVIAYCTAVGGKNIMPHVVKKVGGLQGVADVFHQDEYDADSIGAYISALSGYDANVFHLSLNDSETAHPLHPSQKSRKRRLQALENEIKKDL